MAKKSSQDFGPNGVEFGTSQAYDDGLVRMAKPRSRGRARAAAVIVWTLLIAMILLNVLNLWMTDRNRAQGVETREMMTQVYNPSFKTRYESLGAEIIKAWYNPAITASPIALGSGITWPSARAVEGDGTDQGASTEDQVAATEGNVFPIQVSSVAYIGGKQIETPGVPNAYQEQLYYSAFVNGAYFKVSVTIGINDLADVSAIPTLISPPTISSQIITSSDNAKVGIPADWRAFDSKDSLKSQVNSWAEAWSTNNSTALKQVTGDDSSDAYYTGLAPGDWEYLEPSLQILWAYERPNMLNTVVVQVQWDVKLPDQIVDDPTNPEVKITLVGATQVQRMDLLVQDATTGLPKIVAWGPAGTYPDLEPKQNVITKEEFDKIDQGSSTFEGNAN